MRTCYLELMVLLRGLPCDADAEQVPGDIQSASPTPRGLRRAHR